MQENVTKFSRLENLLSALNLSQKEFSDATGISTSAISQYVTGERPITTKAALKIHKKFPNVNVDWLLEGTGEMLVDSPPPQVAEPSPKYTPKPPRTLEEIIAENEALKAENEALKDEVLELYRKAMRSGKLGPDAEGLFRIAH